MFYNILMNILKYSFVALLIYLPNVAFTQTTNVEEAVDGLGKVERLARLEGLVNSLQKEVAKLKKGLTPASSSSGESMVSTFVKQSELLQVKTELALASNKEIGALKISMNRQARAVEGLESRVDRLKEGELKDMAFKLEALQKSFDALEKSLRADQAN